MKLLGISLPRDKRLKILYFVTAHVNSGSTMAVPASLSQGLHNYQSQEISLPLSAVSFDAS